MFDNDDGLSREFDFSNSVPNPYWDKIPNPAYARVERAGGSCYYVEIPRSPQLSWEEKVEILNKGNDDKPERFVQTA